MFSTRLNNTKYKNQKIIHFLKRKIVLVFHQFDHNRQIHQRCCYCPHHRKLYKKISPYQSTATLFIYRLPLSADSKPSSSALLTDRRRKSRTFKKNIVQNKNMKQQSEEERTVVSTESMSEERFDRRAAARAYNTAARASCKSAQSNDDCRLK